MTLFPLGSRIVAALLLAPAFAAFASPTGSAEPMQVGSRNVATVTPHVPVAAGTPCTVNLFQNVTVMEQGLGSSEDGSGTPYTYAPPAGCHGPWAKVVLRVTVDEEAGGFFSDATKAYIHLGGVPIYQGSMSNVPTQTNPMPANAQWTVERDITDLSALLAGPHHGQVGLRQAQTYWQDNRTDEQAGLSAQLLFYPASAATPAPTTPSAVYRVMPEGHTVTLPHNIVRAYLDIFNQDTWWFTCVTDKEEFGTWPFFSPLAPGDREKSGIAPPNQGCTGGSFAEIGVSIDGTPAGVAPLFPLQSSNLDYTFANAFNAPVQPPQMLNYVPYRVDLTPFAAILDAPGAHTIALSRPAWAYLLVYQDKGATQVSGAVTVNTLAGSPGSPAVTDTIAVSGDTAGGTIDTGLDRDFTIEGFVNTSNGRVDSSVHQTSHFHNTQNLYLEGLDGQEQEDRHYEQELTLASKTVQHSTRNRSGTVLNDDTRTVAYPLVLNYVMDGATYFGDDAYLTAAIHLKASVEQHFNQDMSYLKGGFGLYTSRVRNSFIASRDQDHDTGQNAVWQTQAEFRFYDNQGSCYQDALTAQDGAVASEARGVGCGGHNHVRWYAHPDGTPDSLGWAH